MTENTNELPPAEGQETETGNAPQQQPKKQNFSDIKKQVGEKLAIPLIRHLIIVTGLLATLFAFSHSGVFMDTEAGLYDTNFYMRAIIKGQYEKVPDNIIILSIDDTSLGELAPTLGNWPWERASYANIVDTLSGYGAKAIGLDLLFITDSSRGETDDDIFAGALAKYDNVLLGSNFDITETKQTTTEQLILPLEKFVNNDNYGFINYEKENDGSIRRMTLIKEYLDVKYNSFDAKLYQIASGKPVTKEWEYINFSGKPNHFPIIPIAKLFNEEALHNELADGEIFRNKIVIVGPTAEVFHDTHSTPFSSNQFFAAILGVGSSFPMSGAEVHANAVASLMQNNAVTEVHPALQYLVLFVVLMALATVFSMAGLWAGLGVALFTLLFYWINSYIYFSYYNSFINTIVMIWAITLLFVIMQGLRYIETLRQKMYIQNSFSSYVPKQLVDQLVNNPQMLESFEGEKREITVMFVDIRGFTSLSDTMDPKDVVRILNQYIEIVVDAIEPYGGIIDKFIGDGIMMTFNTLENQPDHQLMAVRSAIAIRDRMKAWLRSTRKGRRDLFSVGVGIASGVCMVGNMGARDKKSFTAIGATVNMAARLESRARGGNSIIMSQHVYEAVKNEIDAVFVEETILKGFLTPVSVYEVINEKGVEVEAPGTNMDMTVLQKAQTQASTNMFDR